jgi:anaerobic magnesium-protoporphyrin IX monomethyl ester cyclase
VRGAPVLDILLAHGYSLAEDAQERRIMRPYPPLGLLYLSSHLKRAGFSVEVFDATFRPLSEFEAMVQRQRPPVVGLYCNLMTKRNVLRMVEMARRAGCAVVLGGPDPPYYADDYLSYGADAVVVGEGEKTLEDLVPEILVRPREREWERIPGLVFRSGGELRRTPPRPLIADLDGQPPPDRDAVDIPAYLDAWRRAHGRGSISLITARGCPYTCTWCSRSVFGETHRRRSVVSVADEVQGLVERYRPEQVWYADDVFAIHRGWTLAFADEMGRRGLRVPFECISRGERIDGDVADALARLGCYRVWIGSESGSQRVLDAMQRRVRVEQVQAATRTLQARGIEVGYFIMLGYDDEGPVDLEETVRHLKEARPDTFLTTVAYPIKGTPYYASVQDRVDRDRGWSETSDRELRVRGSYTPDYYRWARRWMTAEVDRERYWRTGRFVRAARAAAIAGAGRLGMRLHAQRRVG